MICEVCKRTYGVEEVRMEVRDDSGVVVESSEHLLCPKHLVAAISAAQATEAS